MCHLYRLRINTHVLTFTMPCIIARHCRGQLRLRWGVPRLIDGGDILDAQLLINGLSLTGYQGGLILGHCLLLLWCLTLGTSESWWYALCFSRMPSFWLSARKLEPSCHAGPRRGSETQIRSFLNILSEVRFPS